MICGLTEDDVIDRLRAAVAAASSTGSQKAFADAHGISEQYVSDALLRRRPPGPKLLAAIGVERRVYYQLLEEQQS